MSEELIQRGYTNKGLPFAEYEYYNIGNTSIKSLRQFEAIPNREYKGYLRKKPDGILVDRRDRKNIQVIAIIEFKTPQELDTPKKEQKAILQCINEYCKPLSARIGIVSDGKKYIWLNPYADNTKGQRILREDGYPLQTAFSWHSDVEIEKSLVFIRRILLEITSQNSQFLKEQVKNPSSLADSVWQTIWLASGENPDACLATFVEIFVFKYLSDLGVLTQNTQGVKVSFSDVYTKDRDKCLVFYFEQVRKHIKYIFPPSKNDGTGVINGIVLNPYVREHNILFHTILGQFDRFGSLTNIDPEFKSRLYEHFLKKSISQKNWGQFFTPRNIIKAIIELSDIDKLGDGAKVHDPACGVGGFILEPMLTKRSSDYSVKNDTVYSRLSYTGHDRDVKTIILAKANILIHLNELIKSNKNNTIAFAKLFNHTFQSFHNSVLGSIGQIPKETYDLVMTNPPFVMTGTSKIKEFIKDSGTLKHFYTVNGLGVEGLFIEKIIRSLKRGGKAIVIVPDGILNRTADKKLRKFIRDYCYIDAIVSLPENTFYTTPKKTYILALTRKLDNASPQTDAVYSYLVTSTGETLDTNRFDTDNDLPEMVRLFKYFQADKSDFQSPTIKCKIWCIDEFLPEVHWSVDRWWSERERIELGIVNKKNFTTIAGFVDELNNERVQLQRAIDQLHEMEDDIPEPAYTVEITLGDEQFFELFIGKRILKHDIYYAEENGTIPVYSANVKEPFGYMTTSNISDFEHDYVLWGIDGDFEFNVMRRGHPFRTTDHCGAIRIIDGNVNSDYLYYYLSWLRSSVIFDRQLRPNLTNMKPLKIKFPVIIDSDTKQPEQKDPNKSEIKNKPANPIYVLDIEMQKTIAEFYKSFEQVKAEIEQRMSKLLRLEIPPLS